jgi:hypothetical protein
VPVVIFRFAARGAAHQADVCDQPQLQLVPARQSHEKHELLTATRTHFAQPPAAPGSVLRGLRLPPLANVRLPLPPPPPAAATNSSPCAHRSARMSGEGVLASACAAEGAARGLLDLMAEIAAALLQNQRRERCKKQGSSCWPPLAPPPPHVGHHAHLKPHCFAACRVRSTAAGSSCLTLESLAASAAAAAKNASHAITNSPAAAKRACPDA